MQKILIASGLGICCLLASCAESKLECASGAPVFTEAIGTELINNWGEKVEYYSPDGSVDVYTEAAYFTGVNYLSNAVLLPTVSPVTRNGPQEIYDYFTHFLANCPRMVNNPGTPEPGGPFLTLAGCGYGVISGYYNFTFTCGTTPAPANARYTFQFQYLTAPKTVVIDVEGGPNEGKTITVQQPSGQWYILMQNSAQLP